MEKQVKELASMKMIMLLVVYFFITSVIFVNGATEIPADESQVNNWFQTAIKPHSQRQGTLDPDTLEAENAAKTITVRKDGSGKFQNIRDALKGIDTGSQNRIVISIGPGEYKEKIKVDSISPSITFYGDPKDRPILSFDGITSDYGNADNATLTVASDNFIGVNLIVKNSEAKRDGKIQGAAAVWISGDEAAFYNCDFIGFQGTLCDDTGNHFFKNCHIRGTIDFIFGEGRSIYLSTELRVLPGVPTAIIAANARKNNHANSGYSFVHCKITGSGRNAFLGRAWFDASRAIYSYCTMDDVIKPEGWSDDNKPQMQKTVYFGEYKNKGPGASNTSRVQYAKQLTDAEATQFISLEYINATTWLLPPPRI